VSNEAVGFKLYFFNATFAKTDLEDVKTRIRQKPFLGSTLEVEDALPNNRVWVTNLKPAIDKETLELYFEQAKLNPNGGSVEVEYDEPNHMAIINYSDASGTC